MAVSIIDVAKAAGVSHMTVSRVLNRSRGVRPENVAAVMKAVEELGYTPPRRKPGPKPKRRQKMAGKVLLVVPSRPDQPSNPSEVFLSSPFGQQVVAGIDEVADRQRVQVDIVTPTLGNGPVDTQGADGLILVPQLGRLAEPLADVNGLAQVVLAQRSPTRPSCDCVAVNDYMGGEMAVEFLLAQGCTRLAVVTSAPEEAQPLERTYGYRRTALRHDVPAYYVGPVTYRADGPDGRPVIDGSVKTLVDQLMALPQVPDGLAVGVPSMKDFYHELRSRGIEPARKDPRPGKSVVVLASATVELRRNPVKPMPHLISYSGLATGQRLLEQLLRRIGHPDDPVAHILIAPSMLE